MPEPHYGSGSAANSSGSLRVRPRGTAKVNFPILPFRHTKYVKNPRKRKNQKLNVKGKGKVPNNAVLTTPAAALAGSTTKKAG